MISRTAENCFWLMRNIERVETLVNAVDVTNSIALESNKDTHNTWYPLVIVLGGEQNFLASQSLDASHNAQEILKFLIWDQNNPSSLYSSFSYARENARIVRDLISYEMWEIINRTWIWINDDNTKKLFTRNLPEFCQTILEFCFTWKGYMHNQILRDDPYQFMKIGMLLERADLTARLMDVHYHRDIDLASSQESMYESQYWQEMLQYCMSHDAFVRRPYFDIERNHVAEFLLHEDSYPRTIGYCLKEALSTLHRIRPSSKSPIGMRAELKLTALHHKVKNTVITEILDNSHKFITDFIGMNVEVCSQLSQDFFVADASIFAKMLNNGVSR